MNKKFGLILKVGADKVFVAFAFPNFVKKYGKLRKRVFIKKIKVRSKEFKRGDFVFCNSNYTKLNF